MPKEAERPMRRAVSGISIEPEMSPAAASTDLRVKLASRTLTFIVTPFHSEAIGRASLITKLPTKIAA